MKPRKFTFKTHKPTGKYTIIQSHDIKLNKCVVGRITDETWKICLCIIKKDINEDKNPNCPWKWITLKQQSNSLQEAKDFLNKYINQILTSHNLYLFEE